VGGTMATEFIPELKDLRQTALENPAEALGIYRKAGSALATVHRELHLPPDMLRPLPDYLMSKADDNVVLHGDFFWGNVCCLPTQRRIVLLDWAAAPLLGGIANYGSRYFDLLWFSWSLFFWTPPRRILCFKPERLVTALISGYAETESRFQWQRYVQYRSSVRPLLLSYWRSKQQVVPSSPVHSCAQLLGWLRWLLFPRPARAK